ncbi:MAG: hypothetical protein QM765_01715 [Myxococcales bacterium]
MLANIGVLAAVPLGSPGNEMGPLLEENPAFWAEALSVYGTGLCAAMVLVVGALALVVPRLGRAVSLPVVVRIGGGVAASLLAGLAMLTAAGASAASVLMALLADDRKVVATPLIPLVAWLAAAVLAGLAMWASVGLIRSQTFRTAKAARAFKIAVLSSGLVALAASVAPVAFLYLRNRSA